MDYSDNYYARTLADNLVRAPLSGTRDCDVCVIGGGLAGLTAAYFLAKAGQTVVLLEENRIGWGASGRNGGFVSPGYALGRESIASMIGPDDANRLHRLSIDGMRLVKDMIAEHAISDAAPRPGIMSVIRYDTGDRMRADADLIRKTFDYELQFLDRDEVRERLRSSRYFQALRDPEAFHFHPLNYLRGLASAFERMGGTIHESSPALRCEIDTPVKRITTSDGVVHAKDLLVATGGYTGGLIPSLRRARLPIATYVLLSEARPDLIDEAIRTTDAVGDNRRAGDYYRRVDEGKRILWGGRITTRAASTRALAEELRAEMVRTFPQLAGLKVDLAWSGLMSYARHRMPQIGELRPGVWYCTAFGGHGMNTTAIGGKVVADAILGDDASIRLFRPFGLSWTGGAIGLGVAQATFWKLQAQDWWQERRSLASGDAA